MNDVLKKQLMIVKVEKVIKIYTLIHPPLSVSTFGIRVNTSSQKEDLNKAVAQLKTNSKIEKNIEESESSREKEEKANSYTDIFSRSHDQQDSRKNRNRELASQRRTFCSGRSHDVQWSLLQV